MSPPAAETAGAGHPVPTAIRRCEAQQISHHVGFDRSIAPSKRQHANGSIERAPIERVLGVEDGVDGVEKETWVIAVTQREALVPDEPKGVSPVFVEVPARKQHRPSEDSDEQGRSANQCYDSCYPYKRSRTLDPEQAPEQAARTPLQLVLT